MSRMKFYSLIVAKSDLTVMLSKHHSLCSSNANYPLEIEYTIAMLISVRGDGFAIPASGLNEKIKNSLISPRCQLLCRDQNEAGFIQILKSIANYRAQIADLSSYYRPPSTTGQ
jgi:hypothetical protein